MAGYLLTRSEGTIGELAHLLTDAAVEAIESGEEAITQRVLLMAPVRRPDRTAPTVRAGVSPGAQLFFPQEGKRQAPGPDGDRRPGHGER
jgi:hypothetical protein